MASRLLDVIFMWFFVNSMPCGKHEEKAMWQDNRSAETP
jgi:hypothetical protein